MMTKTVDHLVVNQVVLLIQAIAFSKNKKEIDREIINKGEIEIIQIKEEVKTFLKIITLAIILKVTLDIINTKIKEIITILQDTIKVIMIL